MRRRFFITGGALLGCSDPMFIGLGVGVGIAAPPDTTPPIIIAQSAAMEIIAEIGGLRPAQLRVQVAAASKTLGGTMRAAGTSPPVVTLTAGTGSLTYTTTCPGIKVEIDSVAGGTARGQATFRISLDSGATWLASGVLTAATYTIPSGAAAGNVINFPAGTYGTTQSWEAVVATIRSSEGSAYTFTQGTAASMPVFRHASITPDGKAALLFAGSQYLQSVDAAVVALFVNDPARTVQYRVAYTAVNAAGYLFCAANSGTAANGLVGYGQTTTGGGSDFATYINDTAGTSTATSSAVISGTGVRNVCWHGPGANGGVALCVNDVSAGVGVSTWNPGTNTPNRVAIGNRPDSSPGNGVSALLYDLVVHSSDLGASSRTAWHTAMAAGT